MLKNIKFSIALEGKPDKDISYEAAIFDQGGRLIDYKPAEKGQFALAIQPEDLKHGRLLIYPVHPEIISRKKPDLEGIMKLRPYEPTLPKDLRGELVTLKPIPEFYWKWWWWCRCTIRGTVWNNSCHPPAVLPFARVHICEVDPIIFRLRLLSNEDIIAVRDDIRDMLGDLHEHMPDPGALPKLRGGITGQASAGDIIAKKQLNETPHPEAVKSLKENMPVKNLVHFYSSQPDLVRSYLVEHIMYFHPIFCYFRWWWWLRCDEVGVIETNNSGTFELSFWYRCNDRPDLYIWVEYFIDGHWQTVYHPWIGCGTWWNYDCATPVNIYVNDPRVPCPAGLHTPGDNTIVITTIGNNVNVNQVPQSPPGGGGYNNMGLIPGNRPFGGNLEPRILFSANLHNNYYYRWSYSRHGANSWTPLTAAVGRHYFNWVGGVLSLPVHNLGPHTIGGTPGLFEIPDSVGPTGSPWAVVDQHFDLASAYFFTTQLEGGNVANAAGLYDLKFELFNKNTGARVALGNPVAIKLVDSAISAPFGSQALTLVDPDASSYIVENGEHVAYRLTIRVDNNPTTAAIIPVSSDGNSACSGPGCGFVAYQGLGSPTHLSYQAHHPNNFATFGFSIVKGTTGTVHRAAGDLLSPDPSIAITFGAPAMPPGVSEGPSNHFSYDVTAGGLLGACTKAAFAASLGVHATANDGYGRLSNYDSSALQAFALVADDDC